MKLRDRETRWRGRAARISPLGLRGGRTVGNGLGSSSSLYLAGALDCLGAHRRPRYAVIWITRCRTTSSRECIFRCCQRLSHAADLPLTYTEPGVPARLKHRIQVAIAASGSIPWAKVGSEVTWPGASALVRMWGSAKRGAGAMGKSGEGAVRFHFPSDRCSGRLWP